MLFKESLTLINSKRGGLLKILTPKQMFQRLPIALAQVEVRNRSED